MGIQLSVATLGIQASDKPVESGRAIAVSGSGQQNRSTRRLSTGRLGVKPSEDKLGVQQAMSSTENSNIATRQGGSGQ